MTLVFLPMPFTDPSGPPQNTVLLQSLTLPPSSPLDNPSATSTHLATLLFSSLLRSSSRCKQLVRSITPSSSDPNTASAGAFFVPADGPPSSGSTNHQPQAQSVDDEDPPQSLLSMLTEHLSLSFLSRSRAASAETEREAREWDRLIVAYLTLLSQWLWEDSKAVREFLESGGMSVVSHVFPGHINSCFAGDPTSFANASRSRFSPVGGADQSNI